MEVVTGVRVFRDRPSYLKVLLDCSFLLRLFMGTYMVRTIDDAREIMAARGE